MTFPFISFHFKNVGFLTAMSKAPANEVPSPTPWALPTTCRGWERNEGEWPVTWLESEVMPFFINTRKLCNVSRPNLLLVLKGGFKLMQFMTNKAVCVQ